MTNSNSLKGQFLIAMPNLMDVNFHQSVTLICEHNREGALGLVINRLTDVTLDELLAQFSLGCEDKIGAKTLLQSGGPVQPEQCMVLHQPLGSWQHTLSVTADIGLTGSLDILQALATGKGPDKCLICLGYAGWGAGQLEKELLENSWLNGPVDPGTLFDLPIERRWQSAAAALGIDLNLMSADVGHS